MMDVGTLIDRLGGTSSVAAVLKVTPSAVSLWRRQDRVPPAREVAVWRMARDAGLAWTPPGAEGLTLETRQAA